MVHEYIGSKITIISRNDKRYEGVLHSIDVDKSTITLKDVRYFENNSNGRPGPASSTVFEMIVFRGSDITDLAVCQPVINNNNSSNIPQDPAIVSISEGTKTSTANNQQTSKINNSRNSPKVNYTGNKSLNNTNNTMNQNNNKEHTRNRQKGGSSNRNYRGNHHSHFNNHYQRSFVVGELKPRINQALKAELETEFDFSEQNKKFEKQFNSDISCSQPSNSFRTTSDAVDAGNSNDGNFDERRNLTVGGYDKVSGFFDSISCETLDPERSKKPQSPSDPQMKAMREKQKMIDKETFGTFALKPRSNTYNRGPHKKNHNNHRGHNNRYNKHES